jgi:hypothetical protein
VCGQFWTRFAGKIAGYFAQLGRAGAVEQTEFGENMRGPTFLGSK